MQYEKMFLTHPTKEGQGGEWCTVMMMFLSLKQVVIRQEHHEGWCLSGGGSCKISLSLLDVPAPIQVCGKRCSGDALHAGRFCCSPLSCSAEAQQKSNTFSLLDFIAQLLSGCGWSFLSVHAELPASVQEFRRVFAVRLTIRPFEPKREHDWPFTQCHLLLPGVARLMDLW